jgi:hypothetical protein
MRRILRKILAGEEDQLGDISTVSLESQSLTRNVTVLTNGSSPTLALSRRSLRLSMSQRARSENSGVKEYIGVCVASYQLTVAFGVLVSASIYM